MVSVCCRPTFPEVGQGALIQYAWGPAAELTNISRPVHQEWCEKHQFDHFIFTHTPDWTRHPMWETVRIILRFLRERRYEWIVWLDADALIADMDVDLRLTAPGKLLGLVEMEPDPLHINTRHYNCGVMLMRNPTEEHRMGTPVERRLIDLFETVWAGWPCYSTDEHQTVVNECLSSNTPEWLEKLDRTYNSIPYIWTDDNPKVLAWHGFLGDKAGAMRRAVDAIV